MTINEKNFEWAVSQLREAMEANTYGQLTFGMQNGVVGNVKTEVVKKPPVDLDGKKS